jgi:O-antigen ligase
MYVWNYDDPHFLSKIRASAEFRAQSWQPLEIYMYPHSIVLNFWSELGLLGVIGFFWIIVMFFIFGIRAYRIARRAQDPFAYAILGLMTALLATIVHGLVDVPYFKNDLAVLFWIMMGMISFIEIEARKKTINS